MPIAARWRKLSALPAKRGRDAMPGVYELANEAKAVIYIGQSATDVPNRIRQHLSRPTCVQENAAFWRYAYSRVPQAEEASLLAKYQRSFGTLPPCNRMAQRERDGTARYRERSR